LVEVYRFYFVEVVRVPLQDRFQLERAELRFKFHDALLYQLGWVLLVVVVLKENEAAIFYMVELPRYCLCQFLKFIIILPMREQVYPVENITLMVEVHKLLLISGVLFLSAAPADIHFTELPIFYLTAGVSEDGISQYVRQPLLQVVAMLIGIALIKVQHIDLELLLKLVHFLSKDK
jgi:hypothetical protein